MKNLLLIKEKFQALSKRNKMITIFAILVIGIICLDILF
tara:strand:- start:7106 stop:7222 length:117 start_codon:yes stop_codon:yes gene_type:complete